MVLWICVNRYYKVDAGKRKESNKRGLTLFFAHAVGFVKEIWEPTIKHLLASSSDLIDEIWTWEAIQHGDSAPVNEKQLSCLYDWIDNGRDILNFFAYYIPSSPSSTPLPVHLPRVHESVSRERNDQGLSERKIVAIGHSFGGCTSALAALTNPDLFFCLILLDPVIVRPLGPGEKDDYAGDYVVGALLRRDTWKSKSEAIGLLKKIPFFSSWDPGSLEVYAECGLTGIIDEKGNELVKLKAPSLQEAVVFSSIQTQMEVYARLPTLDDKIKLRWVMPGRIDPDDLVGPPGATQQRVWLRPINSSNVRIPNAGHLIPHEAPRELADEIRDILQETEIRTKL
ncbi:hypothetical protein M378DRAFT_169193 [Amanita muscaria Koide BX008]|uniref:AB hydrolase-1 domain-containing protein n=1 Tax=Amanita muscaria (strain Koide BX008) TaxID=946122 RepID=A0A0C2WS30_AMAMK|nr:hypothetical protein M378DRAFT_169193 [Amanita muscaria Koide BX008]